jgi:alcohol dehydrogenase class IV
MHKNCGTAFGKGALRHLFSRLHDVDAALVVTKGEVKKFAYFYMKIDTLAESSIARFDRAKALALEHGARIKIIGPDFVRKKLAKR